MENNGNQLVMANQVGDTQYVDVKRVMPQNHPSIEVLKFYNDIQNIMDTPISQNLNFKA